MLIFFNQSKKKLYLIIREDETFDKMGVINNDLLQSHSSCLSDCEVVQIVSELFVKQYESSNTLAKVC